MKVEMSDNATAEEMDAITDVVRTLHDYGVSVGLRHIEGPFEVYAYESVDEVSDAYDRVVGEERRREREEWMRAIYEYIDLPARSMRDFWEEGSGLIIEGGSRLFWLMRYDDLANLTYGEFLNPDVDKLRYRDLTTGELARRLYGVYMNEIVSPRESIFPVWLHEGVRELLEGRAIYFAEGKPYGGMCSIRRILRYLPPSERADAVKWLKETEDGITYPWDDDGGDGNWRDSWIYGYAAAEFLASRAGESSLMRYYYASDPQTDWRDTFSAAFGMTVDEFYDLFGEYSAEGFQGLDFSCIRRLR